MNSPAHTTLRLTEKLAKRIARDFHKTSRAHAWRWSDTDLVLDALVMDEIRVAWSADSTHAFAAEELVEFRKMLAAALAAKGFLER